MNLYVFMNVCKCTEKISRLVVILVSEARGRISRIKADFTFHCFGFIFHELM